MKINLYQEIKNNLKSIRYSESDILYVSCIDKKGITKCFESKDFLEFCKNINYEGGYGTIEISQTLKIVFKDGSFLERREYDGSEYFEYVPVMNLNAKIEKFNPEEIWLLY